MGLIVQPLGVAGRSQTLDLWAGLNWSPQQFRAVLGDPPARGSRAEADDLAILRWSLLTKTPQSVLHSWTFLDRRLSAFNAAAGVDLDRTAPQLLQALKVLLNRVDVLKNQLKDQVARPRPYLSHPELVPCLPREDGFSYPSGHATWYSTAALLLADLLPQRRERLMQVGEQASYARPACAVHYPSDVIAAQRLAAAIAAAVVRSPQWSAFKQQYASEITALTAQGAERLPLLTN